MNKYRTFVIAIMMLLGCSLMAQKQPTNSDTAHAIVDRYLSILNISALPQDSVLVVESEVSVYKGEDTYKIRSYYAYPYLHRIEVYHSDTVQVAWNSNGEERFRQYYPVMKGWADVGAYNFYQRMVPYDFRGPLYSYKDDNAVLTYKGTAEIKGNRFSMVYVEAPDKYSRTYLFDTNSGLLNMLIEGDEIDGMMYDKVDKGHIQWKITYEYMPIGASLLPSLESFLRDGVMTIIRTKYHFIPMNKTIFNSDRWDF